MRSRRVTWGLLGVPLVLAAGCGRPAGPDTAAGVSAPPGPPAPIDVQLAGPPGARTGRVVTVQVRMGSPSGQPYVHEVSWGDGSPVTHTGRTFSCPASAAGTTPAGSPSPPPPAAATDVLQHVYRLPGTHRVTVTAGHGGCFPPIPAGTGTGHLTVRVTGLALPGNGPVAPDGAVALRADVQGVLTGDVEGHDVDGYVRRLTVDWGGGEPETFVNPRARSDPGTYWRQTTFRHGFRRALALGDHALRLVVESTDCHGHAVQTTVVDRPVRVSPTGYADLAPPRRLPPYPPPYREPCCYLYPAP